MSKNSNTIYQRTKSFLEKAKIVHGDKYDYSLVEYMNSKNKVEITCYKHGIFKQIPNNHLNGQGCAVCSGNHKHDNHSFIRKSKKIHGDKYDYSKIEYTKNYIKVNSLCHIHGEFMQIPKDHLNNHGCPSCANQTRSIFFRNTKETFVKQALIVHDNKYNYSLVEYINTDTKIDIICPMHGCFLQTPHNHLNGTNCPNCVKKPFSQIAINWIDSISLRDGILIQHALNIGEYRIPNTRYYVDGYCVNTNTIYEFHGDAFHGNPKKFNHNDNCHPFDKSITAGELYQRTMTKENIIKEKGYNLVTIWEYDFRNKLLT